jgi:hypothetical protein
MSGRRCPSELTWTRHLAGELGWLAALRLRVHAAGCEGCRRSLEDLAAERAAFAAAPRRQRDLAALGARAQEPGATARDLGAPRGRNAWRLSGLVAAGVAAAAVIVARGPDRDPEWIGKGGDLLALHVETASGAAPLGATCAAGDQLMASYATGHAYLLLLERDGDGRIQVLLPPGGTASARLAGPRGTTPQSFVLDEATGPECFAAFFSDTPIEAARAGEALARAAGTPELPGAVTRMICCQKRRAP